MTSPRTLMKGWNLRAKKRFGQNFLENPEAGSRIVSLAGIQTTDTVLEIGPGLGALTLPLAKQAREVHAFEIDTELIRLLRTELMAAEITNVKLYQEDILKTDSRRLSGLADEPLIVLGNLPYNISSQILVWLILNRKAVSKAVLMFQKEMADRISSGPGSKNYGRLSVMTQFAGEIRPLLELSASQFFPRPKVDSVVLEIRFFRKSLFPVNDESFLFKVIKAAFGQRRKTLKNAILGSALGIPAGQVSKSLELAAIDPMRRAETLSVSEFVRLSEVLSEASLQDAE